MSSDVHKTTVYSHACKRPSQHAYLHGKKERSRSRNEREVGDGRDEEIPAALNLFLLLHCNKLLIKTA